MSPSPQSLLDLQPGWRDGEGKRPNSLSVTLVSDFLDSVSEEHRSRLHVFPTLEGGVTLECQEGARRWSLEVEADQTLVLVQVAPGMTTEVSYSQDVNEAISSFCSFLG